MSQRNCVECGRAFEAQGRRPGAPNTICSDSCRRRRRNKQQTAWRSSHSCPERSHGTLTGYGTYGCRCESCKAANTAYSRHKRAERDGVVPSA